jgi:hypothetical protein
MFYKKNSILETECFHSQEKGVGTPVLWDLLERANFSD